MQREPSTFALCPRDPLLFLTRVTRAAADLKTHVELAARELSLERFAKFENELYQV